MCDRICVWKTDPHSSKCYNPDRKRDETCFAPILGIEEDLASNTNVPPRSYVKYSVKYEKLRVKEKMEDN